MVSDNHYHIVITKSERMRSMIELRHIEAAREYCMEEEYRNVVARIVIAYYQDKVDNRLQLQYKVNSYLVTKELKEVSYNFVVQHSSKKF